MKKFNILLGCLLIASGTLSACSYYDEAVERKIVTTPTVECETDGDCNGQSCVSCSDGAKTAGLCAVVGAKYCLNKLNGGERCVVKDQCKTDICLNIGLADSVCSCSSEAACKVGECSDNLSITADTQSCAFAAEGDPCIDGRINCAEGFQCVNNVCEKDSGGDKKENGADCTGDDECTSGYCNKTNKCAEKGSDVEQKGNIDDPCKTENDCVEGLICKNDKCAKKEEKPKANVGEACETTNDCATDLLCNSKKVCEEKKSGAECKDDTTCKTDEFCFADTGKCVLRAKDKESCSSNKLCIETHYCSEQTAKCAEKNVTGYKCSNNYECKSNNCNEGKCAIRCGGGSCKVNQVCSDDLECLDTVECPNDKSKRCLLTLKLTPNLQWQYGKIDDSWILPNPEEPEKGDYYGNILTLSLPDISYHDRLDFCARPLTAFGSFMGDNNQTYIDDPIIDPENAADGDYKCKDIKNKNFVETYQAAMGMLKTIATDLANDASNAYAAAVVKYLFKTASYDTEDNKTVYPFGKDCELDDPFACLAKKIGDKTLTCDEYLAFYKQFGYDFRTLMSNLYISGRLEMPCIELSLGEVMPFTLNYRNPKSKWLNHNLYLVIALFPSPLMGMNDAYSVGMEPTYVDTSKLSRETNFSDPLTYMQAHSFLNTCAGGIDKQGCIRTLMSKFDVSHCGADFTCSGTSDYGFNVIATYNLNYPNNFSCDDKYTRINVCPSSVEEQTLTSHSSAKDCTKANLSKAEIKTEYPNCVPTLAINAYTFYAYIEVTDKDLNEVNDTAQK